MANLALPCHGRTSNAGPSAADAGDAGEPRDDGPIPPAPSETGCAMRIDGELLPPSSFWAELGYQNGKPALTCHSLANCSTSGRQTGR